MKHKKTWKSGARWFKVREDKIPTDLKRDFSILCDFTNKALALKSDFRDKLVAAYRQRGLIDDDHTLKCALYWGTLSVKIVPQVRKATVEDEISFEQYLEENQQVDIEDDFDQVA